MTIRVYKIFGAEYTAEELVRLFAIPCYEIKFPREYAKSFKKGKCK